MNATLYYEAHVTVEPVFEERLVLMKDICMRYGFRVADLLMQRRKDDTAERSKHDTFCTTRTNRLDEIGDRVRGLVRDLKAAGFQVWRYKVEDTVVDSKIGDAWGIL